MMQLVQFIREMMARVTQVAPKFQQPDFFNDPFHIPGAEADAAVRQALGTDEL